MAVSAVVLAGGKGTRSADSSKAKLVQEVGGRSLMEWHVDNLRSSGFDEIVVVAGHLGGQVQAACDRIDTDGAPLRVIHEPEQAGTVAAVDLAAQSCDSDEFLVVLGDVLMSVPIARILEAWRESGAQVSTVVHPSTHPEDSDTAFPERDGRVTVIPKSEPRDHVPNMSSAGLFAITRAALDRYGSTKDFGSDLLPLAAAASDLHAYVTSHYLKDTGTPSRLDSARTDMASGAFERRGRLTLRPAVFLDRDGVIIPALPEVYDPSQLRLVDGVAEAIAVANHAGVPVLVATNQPGISKGFMSFATHQRIRARMDHALAERGAFVDDYDFCPHHPTRGFENEVPDLKVPCECRKPGPGMLISLANRHGIDLAGSIMVGDSDRDAEAARRAGVGFIRTAEASSLEPAEAIRQALRGVLC